MPEGFSKEEIQWIPDPYAGREIILFIEMRRARCMGWTIVHWLLNFASPSISGNMGRRSRSLDRTLHQNSLLAWEKCDMATRHYSWAAACVVGSLVTVFVIMTSYRAHAQSQYPIMDAVAAKVIQKYQDSTCEQLWERRNSNAPPSMEETRVLTLLRDDSNMRAAFIKIVAPPIASKLFDCGMIP
jgi:hypothetical protein